MSFYKTTTRESKHIRLQGVSIVHKQFAAHAQMEYTVQNKNNAALRHKTFITEAFTFSGCRT